MRTKATSPENGPRARRKPTGSWPAKPTALGCFALLLLFFCQPDARAIETGAPLPTGPVEVLLRDGRSHRGEPVSLENNLFTVREFLDGGEVEWVIRRETIERVRFPGADTEREARALLDEERHGEAFPLLRALWRQRSPWLELLRETELALLAALPGLYLQRDDPDGAINTARRLRPLLPPGMAGRAPVSEALLQSLTRVDLLDEARQLAREWALEQGRFGGSALGWLVLAELAMNNDDPEEALWLALQPVAFSGPLPMSQLETCYALAARAHDLLGEEDQARALFQEMTVLGLPWPEDRPEWSDTERNLREWLDSVREAEAAAEEEAETGADLNLRPPEDDLNLPIQHVRKLLHPGPNS